MTRPYLRVANVQAGRLDLDSITEITVPRSVANACGLRPGDVLMTEGGDLDKLGRGTVWRGEIHGCLHQNHVFALRPVEGRLDARFLAYATQSASSRTYFESTGTKTTNLASTNSSKVLDLPLPLPPITEQRHIADFLDGETSRMDSIIVKRSDQRELLDERLLAAAFAAITGVTEAGERRPSDIEWLGSLPAGWPLMPVSFQYEVLLGKMLNEERARGEHLKPYLRNTNVQWDRIDTDDLVMMDFPPGERPRYRVHPGDLLVCEGGEPGRAAIWNGAVGEVYYQKALHRVRPRSYSSNRWLYYCIRVATAQNVFAVEGNTTTIAHLTREQLKVHRFPFPPRPTQDRLVAQLDDLAHRRRKVVEQLAKQEELLAERRQALITAAVTGEFDVSSASGRGVVD